MSLILFISFSVLLLYVLIAEPLISRLCFRSIVYQGVDYYKNQSYLEFEHGEDFDNVVSEFEFINKCEIIEFYYFDNKIRDNIIYGKMCDFFVLEFSPLDDYDSVSKSIEANTTYCGMRVDYKFYVASISTDSDSQHIVFALNDKNQILRFIFITDYPKDHIRSNSDITSTIFSQTNLEWH